MIKSIYVIRDELSGEIVNVFLANNDDVAKIIIKKSSEKVPLFGDLTLHKVGYIEHDPSEPAIKIPDFPSLYAKEVLRINATKGRKNK